MLTYHQVMTTDLSLLTTAAAKWEAAAKDFETVQGTYDSQVRNVAVDGSWTGTAATTFRETTKTQTYNQYTAAAAEARAVASLLRDAHGQFTELRKKLENEVKRAEEAGMKVSENGSATFDFAKADKALADAARHDPDLHTTEATWSARIATAVQAVDDADQGVKLALQAAVQDTDLFDGFANGFNAKAEGDIEKVEAKKAAELALELDSKGHLDEKKLAELERLFRDNSGNKEFSRTLLDNVGADGAIKLSNKLDGLTSSDKSHKQDYLALQGGLATSVSTATADAKTPFYEKWREELRKAGEKNFGSKTNPLYGYQSFVSLMGHHDQYGKAFLNDLGNDIIATEKQHDGIWNRIAGGHKGIGNDPLDGLLGIMGKQPDAATAFFDPGADGKNEHLKYLLKDRHWPKWTTVGPAGIHDLDDPASRMGFGSALEAAATGKVPGTHHALGGHSEAEARVMHDTIRVLNSDWKGDKLPQNLRSPLGHMLTDYTSDTHEILPARTSTTRNSTRRAASGRTAAPFAWQSTRTIWSRSCVEWPTTLPHSPPCTTPSDSTRRTPWSRSLSREIRTTGPPRSKPLPRSTASTTASAPTSYSTSVTRPFSGRVMSATPRRPRREHSSTSCLQR